MKLTEKAKCLRIISLNKIRKNSIPILLMFFLKILDYIFVTKEEFQEAIKREEFVEYAMFSGNYYGTR